MLPTHFQLFADLRDFTSLHTTMSSSSKDTPMSDDPSGAATSPTIHTPEQFSTYVKTNPAAAFRTVKNQHEQKIAADRLVRDLTDHRDALAQEIEGHESIVAGLQAQLHSQTIELEELRGRLAQIPVQPASVPFAPARSQKLKDPDTFDGNRAKYEDWKLTLQLKLVGNEDHFASEQQKIAYAISLLRDKALSQMRGHTDPITGLPKINQLQDFFVIIDRAFGDPDKQGTAQAALGNLRQRNLRFAEYYAEFSHIAVHTGFNDAAKKAQLLKGLSHELHGLLINHEYEEKSFEETVTLCQRLDIRHTIFQSQHSQHRFRAGPPGSRAGAGAAPAVPPVTRLAVVPVPPAAPAATFGPVINADGTVPMDLSAGRVRGPLTDEEKQRRRAQNLCLYCGGPGHVARLCPRRPQTPGAPIVGHAASVTPSTDSPADAAQGKA